MKRVSCKLALDSMSINRCQIGMCVVQQFVNLEVNFVTADLEVKYSQRLNYFSMINVGSLEFGDPIVIIRMLNNLISMEIVSRIVLRRDQMLVILNLSKTNDGTLVIVVEIYMEIKNQIMLTRFCYVVCEDQLLVFEILWIMMGRYSTVCDKWMSIVNSSDVNKHVKVAIQVSNNSEKLIRYLIEFGFCDYNNVYLVYYFIVRISLILQGSLNEIIRFDLVLNIGFKSLSCLFLKLIYYTIHANRKRNQEISFKLQSINNKVMIDKDNFKLSLGECLKLIREVKLITTFLHLISGLQVFSSSYFTCLRTELDRGKIAVNYDSHIMAIY